MQWLRRSILLGLLSALAVVVFRRLTAPDPADDAALAEWPPLTLAPSTLATSTLATSSLATSALATSALATSALATSTRSPAISTEPTAPQPGTDPWPPTVGPSSWLPPVDGTCPDGYPIKVAKSGIFHLPDGRSYARTHPERCYARTEDAEADGYRRAKL